MIKNIIFDIGRVLLDYQPMQFLADSGFSEAESLLLNEVVFKNDLWLLMDRGVISREEAIEEYCKIAPLHEEKIKKVMYTWPSMLTPIKGSPELLRQLKRQKYRIYLLSNFQKEGFETIYPIFGFLGEAEGKVISYEVKMLKPEKEIYRYLLNKFQLIAEETVFIDDLTENVEAAKALGIKGIVFESAEQTKESLRTLGIAI